MKSFFFSLLLLLLVSCGDTSSNTPLKLPPLVPLPQSVEQFPGGYAISEHVAVLGGEDFPIATEFLKEYLQNAGISLGDSSSKASRVVFEKDTTLPAEGYHLLINEEGVSFRAKEDAGAFYGVQTLRQLLPVSLETGEAPEGILLPLVAITDAPRFPYRGVHLDVGRHFYGVDFVKKYLSYLAMLKMNYFHWHLTEDQGWRIEIKQYPNLTAHGGFREETLEGHYNDTPRKYDGTRYGGYYTQEEIKEVVAYAEKLNITIIPEIEMPGHAQAAISAYPELGCTGTPVPVATEWGVFEEVYCPKETTFEFLENVLSEVIGLFPGPYIHIGGDEAPKAHWKNCAHCQELIKKEGLADEHELQSYFIKRIEAFLNRKGKKLIGWDEILEGGLAPNATVMSWRGMQGGIEAAKQGHPVIMTPTSHCYFDYYQSESPNEPLAIGGYLPLEKVYHLNPVPDSLSDEEAAYILGAQANLWTEYMDSEAQVEYMLFPRVLALSEVVWTGPSAERNGDFSEFTKRAERYLERLDVIGVHHANHFNELQGKVSKVKDSVFYQLNTLSAESNIQYRINGNSPSEYTQPIPIIADSFIEAQVMMKGAPVGTTFKDTLYYHNGISAEVHLNVQPHPSYNKGGIQALNNGRMGSASRYGDSEWLGFWGDDLEINYNFPKPIELSSIQLRFFHAPGQWIYAPRAIVLTADMEDGSRVQKMIVPHPEKRLLKVVIDELKKSPGLKASSLKLTVLNSGVIPDGKQGAGNKAWTFIDEIIIR